MRLKRAVMVLLLATFAALAGCDDQSGRDPEANVDPGLAPITYVVTGVTTAGKQHRLVPDTEIRIRFADGKVILTAGCNTMSGDYTLEESRLTVHDLATTDMGCDQARMDQDTWLAGLFAKAVQFMPGADASIVSGSTVLTMSDREKVSPDLPLEGTQWVLDTVITDGTAMSNANGSTASLVINDGRVTVNDGCFTETGRVTVSGDALTFGDIVVPAVPCPTTPDNVSGAVHAVVSGTASYRIDERTLTITNGDRGLGFHADS